MLIGIVGRTNTGKSSLFKAATLAEVEIANRPFVTIKPSHGIGFVKVNCPDKDFDVKCNPKSGYCLDGNRFVPIDLLDVAGLIRGAHKGAGLGLQFLDDLRQADALIEVIDASGSTNDKGEPAQPGNYNPREDIIVLEEEIDMWFYGLIKKGWDRLAKQIQQEKLEVVKALAKQFSGLKITEEMVEDTIKELDLYKNITSWTEEDLKGLAITLRKRSKPMIIAANKIDLPGAKENLETLKKEFKDYSIIPCSAEAEIALREAARKGLIRYVPGEDNFQILKEEKLNEQQKKALEFIKKSVLDVYGSTGVQDVLNMAVFELLKYIPVYPVTNNRLEDKDGRRLPDCFIVPEGTTASEFAFKIHSDIGNNFVKAIDLRTKQAIGKDHKLRNSDVIEIMTSK
ncbi:MAG: redox-regulated ATPase YchF [Nanoarchaeota archaeon]|nr:redox-regulated ATPase YchF [Nanoarchaeota archaeon]